MYLTELFHLHCELLNVKICVEKSSTLQLFSIILNSYLLTEIAGLYLSKYVIETYHKFPANYHKFQNVIESQLKKAQGAVPCIRNALRFCAKP